MTEKGYALQDKSCGIAFSLYDGKRFMKKLISAASFRTHTLEHLPMEFSSALMMRITLPTGRMSINGNDTPVATI